MRVAIVGSRDETCAARKAAVIATIDELPAGTVVVSGDARGVDSWVRDAAYVRGLVFVRCVAPWTLGPKAGPLRNAVIVEIADRMTAFPAEREDPGPGKGSGTWNAIRTMREAGKPVEVIYVSTP